MQALLDWLAQALNDLMSWWWDTIKSAFSWIWERILDLAIYLIGLVPVPQAFQEVGGAWDQAVNVAGYFMAPWQLGTGLTWIFGALVARWILRRIPIVG